MRRGLALILTLGLAACVGAGDDAPSPVIVGGEIATTALPPPPGAEIIAEPAAVPSAGTPAAEPADVPADAVEPADGEAAPAEPPAEAPVAEEAVAEEPVAEAPVAEAPVAEPEPPRSETQIRCERRGGSWMKVIPGSEARSCVRRTRDSGRRCDDGTDCQGDCLARSGTCSPVMPLFGCQEILDDTGRRMTQCIE